MRLNLARCLERSEANGPGERFVLWVQGCPLACPGCWNPDTWDFVKREQWDVDDLVKRISAVPKLEGVTFTGGEPFAQARPLTLLAQQLRRQNLSVVIFTGYEWSELQSSTATALLAEADVVIAGRYIAAQRRLDLPLRSSSNQSLHFLTDRYTLKDLIQITEIQINTDGNMVLTGFPEDDWR